MKTEKIIWKQFFQDLQILFNRIDTDGSNSLNLMEVVLFLKSITDDLSDENIETIFNRLDIDGNKDIDFEEFTVSWHFEPDDALIKRS